MSVRITKNNIYLQVGIRKIKIKSGANARLIYSVVCSVFCSAFSQWRTMSEKTETVLYFTFFFFSGCIATFQYLCLLFFSVHKFTD